MLVLTRRAGEIVKIGDDIFIQVVRIGADTVRLGITARSDMPIVRSELLIPECHTCGEQLGDDQEQVPVDGKVYCERHVPKTL